MNKTYCVCPVSRKYLNSGGNWPAITVHVNHEVLHTMQSMIENGNGTEQAAILGMDRETGVVTHLYVLNSGAGTDSSVDLGSQEINEISQAWFRKGVCFAGVVHSHPTGVKTLSKFDLAYAQRVLTNNPQKQYLLMGVVIPGDNIFYVDKKDANKAVHCPREVRI